MISTPAKIICRTIGTAGMGMSLANAFQTGKYFSKTMEEDIQAEHLENVYYSSRTLSDVNYNANMLREKGFELRSKNPLYAIYGKIKGGIGGFLYGLGCTLPGIACSALALLCKNWVAKAGAIGVAAGVLLTFVKEGFGLGKTNPMK
jgi:hypothetical protein